MSVVLPIRNEEDFIERGLAAILSQDYPSELLEIIIADGQSTDQTRTIIEKIKNESDIPITVVDNPERIAPTGLNAAIEKAKGEVIIRIDGHTIVENDYVSECVSALKRSDACNVGGRMNAISENHIGNAIAVATSSPFGVGNARFHYSEREEYVDTVYMGAWRRSVFEEFGNFNAELVRNQDDEFNYRLRSFGNKILLSPRIRSKYYNRSTFKSLWRQYFQYGYWKIRILQLHPKQMSVRQFIPFGFVFSLITLGILSAFFESARWAFLAIVSLYLIASVVATLKEFKRAGIAVLPFVLVAFVILHVSYGLGFLVGLFAFRNRWQKSEKPGIP